jgi:hypothetical protein
MKLKVITPSTEELLTVAEAKQFLRVTHSLEDAMIGRQIAAARRACENGCRMSFTPQVRQVEYEVPMVSTWGELMRAGDSVQDSDDILLRAKLPRGPVAAINSVKAFKRDGLQEVTIPAEGYYSLRDDEVIWAKNFWETYRSYDSILINYTAGLSKADFVAATPDLVEAICITLGNFYENRGFATQQIPVEAQAILNKYWKPL